jgi:outer membrane protein OmpA-like peptidoglycan-associated protein
MKVIRKFLQYAALAATAFTVSASVASAHDTGLKHKHNANQTERYVPTVWVDPDGCQHWVMDDGWEGYMTPNVSREGIPVCDRGNPCGVISSDQLFASGRHAISLAGKHALVSFFQQAKASAFIIEGHTDSRADDAYNMRLSQRRANAVAGVAQSVGVRIAAVRGYGERIPIASNGSRTGMAKNRRVEIMCIR